ncbi:MAG: hypothetical protein NTX56_04160 [Proteobacteria bacterium]|nr:hypothetical protein [Pseudomonadota bacterium]
MLKLIDSVPLTVLDAVQPVVEKALSRHEVPLKLMASPAMPK